METLHLYTPNGSLLLHAQGVNAATAQLCDLLSGRHGDHYFREDERRGGRVREFPGVVTVELADPLANLTVLRGRQANPWTSLAEFPWLIAGRSDVAWLAPYMPRAAEFTDDGRNWRAAYGPRLRRWEGGHAGVRFDQLARVVDMLRRDASTRQAVVSLWDPLADLAPKYQPVVHRDGPAGEYPPEVRSKDYPCTNWLHFQVKDTPGVGLALDLTVCMRSNDLMWGFSGVNVTNFTLLQQLVAKATGFAVGTYRHVCDNLHVYERHLDRLERVAGSWDLYGLLRGEGFEHDVPWLRATPGASSDGWEEGMLELGDFTTYCRKALDFVSSMREHASGGASGPSFTPEAAAQAIGYEGQPRHYLPQWVHFMLLHPHAKNVALHNPLHWDARLDEVVRLDWRAAALGWLVRRALASEETSGDSRVAWGMVLERQCRDMAVDDVGAKRLAELLLDGATI